MVDVQKLKESEELKTPIEDEAKRQSVDAAKKRAALQNVDYPCFAALVSCAHLKPVTRKELDSKTNLKNQRHNGSVPAWSFDVSGRLQPDLSKISTNKYVHQDLIKSEDRETTDDAKSEILIPERRTQWFYFENPLFKDDEPIGPTPCNTKVATPSLHPPHCVLTTQQRRIEIPGLPYSSDHFIKEWKLLSAHPSSDRFKFLSQILPSNLPTIFRVEIPPFLLEEILQTLHDTTTTFNTRSEGKWKEKENERDKNLLVNHYRDQWQKNSSNYNHQSDTSTSIYEKQMKIEPILDEALSSNLMNQPKAQEGEYPKRKQKEEVNFAATIIIEDFEKLMHWIVSVLDALRSCGRFELTVKLIGKKARQTAREIIEHITHVICEVHTNQPRPSDLLMSYNCQ